jgi:hypothetical protein
MNKSWSEDSAFAAWIVRTDDVWYISVWVSVHNIPQIIVCTLTAFHSDRLFRTMTDLVVSEGYAAVGYEYINIDDCWLEKERSYSGQLVPDKLRFQYGLQDLSDYVSYVMLPCGHVHLHVHKGILLPYPCNTCSYFCILVLHCFLNPSKPSHSIAVWGQQTTAKVKARILTAW